MAVNYKIPPKFDEARSYESWKQELMKTQKRGHWVEGNA